MPVPTIPLGDSDWRGMNSFHAQQDVPDRFAEDAQNLHVEAGQWVSRPGFQGQLAAKLSGTPDAATTVTQADGTTYIWFEQGGALYRYIPGETAPRLVPLPAGVSSLATGNAVITQAAGYVYVADGTATGLMRFKADGTGAETAKGLQTPAVPTAALTNFKLAVSLAAADWGAPAIPTANYVLTADANFNGTDGFWSYSNGGYYNSGSGLIIAGAATGAADLPNVGSSVQSRLLTPAQNTNAASVCGIVGAIPAKIHVVSVFLSSGLTDTATARLKISCYQTTNGSDAPVDTYHDYRVALGTFITETAAGEVAVFDCRNIAAAAALRFSVTTAAGTHNVSNITGDYLAATNCSIISPPCIPGFVVGEQGELIVQQGSIPACDPATGLAGSTILCAGTEFETALAAPLNLSTVQTILIRLRSRLTDGAGRVQVTPFLRNATAHLKASLPLADFDNTTTLAHLCDLTTLDPALTANVTHLGFTFATDCIAAAATQLPYPNASTLPIFACYGVSQPGNIAPRTTLTYRVSEWDGSRDTVKLFDVIQSDGSPPSPDVSTDAGDGALALTIPAKKNAAATHYAVYRFGDNPDGTGALIALVPTNTNGFAAGADTPKGSAPYYAAPANPYIAVATRAGNTAAAPLVLTDNTPAGFLLYANLYESGREAPPVYVREIVAWQNRLWLLCNGQQDNRNRSEIYGSWLLSSDNNAGLYFSRAVAPSDPEQSVKGFYTHVGLEDGDRALRLLCLEDRLAILFQRKPPYLLLGTDPASFDLREYTTGNAHSLGLQAKRAACVFGGACVFLTPNGLVAWNTAAPPRNLSQVVRALVTPQLNSQTPYNPAAVALASLWEHGGRLYLSMPTAPTDTAPTQIFRFDVAEAWTEDLATLSTVPFGKREWQGVPNGSWSRIIGYGATGGVGLGSASDTTGHYVIGRDGQIYLLTPNGGDKPTSGAPESAFAWLLQSRRYGGGPTAEQYKTCYWAGVELQSEDADPMTVTLTVAGREPGHASTTVITLPGGSPEQQRRGARVSNAARGETFQVTISGAAKRRFALAALRVMATPRGDRRTG